MNCHMYVIPNVTCVWMTLHKSTPFHVNLYAYKTGEVCEKSDFTSFLSAYDKVHQSQLPNLFYDLSSAVHVYTAF